MRLVDEFLLAFPDEAACLTPVLAKVLQVVQQDAAAGELGDVALHAYLLAFARLLLMHPAAFSAFFAAHAPGALLSFVDLFVEKLDNLGDPPKRKLVVLALCRLLPLPEQWLLSRAAAIANAVVSVLCDVEGALGYE